LEQRDNPLELFGDRSQIANIGVRHKSLASSLDRPRRARSADDDACASRAAPDQYSPPIRIHRYP